MLRLKYSILSFLALFVLVMPQASMAENKHNEIVEAPQTMIVKFYADWCGSCKVMQPELDKFLENTKDKSTLYVHFDLTDEQTRQKSAYLAHSLGLEDIYKEHAAKTGFALLVDNASKTVEGKITKEMSSADMMKMLES
ncbi:MAG: hypothetical protein CO093_09165 [Alphaproteobacteria bacterium CG_4_9_14_3_um_filter_47_13]|nr:MAG: hypothetical protein CO093_09165 [Alphaproteobacteria bacterium CG_4_9_14_3_um_filter_47_13]